LTGIRTLVFGGIRAKAVWELQIKNERKTPKKRLQDVTSDGKGRLSLFRNIVGPHRQEAIPQQGKYAE